MQDKKIERRAFCSKNNRPKYKVKQSEREWRWYYSGVLAIRFRNFSDLECGEQVESVTSVFNSFIGGWKLADNDIPNNEKVHAEESPEIGVTNVLTSYRFREQIELDFLEWVGCKHEECVHQSSEFRCFAEEKCS